MVQTLHEQGELENLLLGNGKRAHPDTYIVRSTKFDKVYERKKTKK